MSTLKTSTLRTAALFSLAALAACGGRRPPPAAGSPPPPWLDAEIDKQAAALAPGTVRVGEHSAWGDEGRNDKAEWNVMLDAGKCYAFSLVGEPGIEKLDLALISPSGSKIAKQAAKRTPNLLMEACPKEPGRHRLVADIDDGEGHYKIGVFAKDAPPTAIAPPPPAAPDLGAQVDAEANVQAAGAQRVGEHFAGTNEADWSTMLEAGKCYWLVGVGGEGVRELELFLWDPRKSRVADSKPKSHKATIGHCATQTGMYRFQGKVDEGKGDFKVGLYVKAPPGSTPAPTTITQTQPPPSTMNLEQAIEYESKSAAPGAIKVGNTFSGSGTSTDWFTTMDPGKCYWLIAAAQPTVEALSVYLWDPSQKRVADNRSASNKTMVGFCPTVKGMYKVQAKVEKGQGDYKLGIYSKKQ